MLLLLHVLVRSKVNVSTFENAVRVSEGNGDQRRAPCKVAIAKICERQWCEAWVPGEELPGSEGVRCKRIPA